MKGSRSSKFKHFVKKSDFVLIEKLHLYERIPLNVLCFVTSVRFVLHDLGSFSIPQISWNYSFKKFVKKYSVKYSLKLLPRCLDGQVFRISSKLYGWHYCILLHNSEGIQNSMDVWNILGNNIIRVRLQIEIPNHAVHWCVLVTVLYMIFVSVNSIIVHWYLYYII